MNKNLDWVFEERHPEETASGEDVSGRVIRSPKLSELAVLGREGGQNTLNQPTDITGKIPVDVEIKLIELTGSHKNDYLANLKWNKLEKHLEASASRSSQNSSSLALQKSLADIKNSRKSLFLLNIICNELPIFF